jgi:hypothetical protein
MSQAFGTKFIVLSDVQQILPQSKFQGGPWVHHASIARGFKEYVVLRHINTNKIYIERIDPKDPQLFIRIEDDSEWNDLYAFCKDAGLLNVSGEIKVGQQGLPGFKNVKSKMV